MIEQDEHIRRLIRAALDDAFKLQIGLLYKVWLTQPGDTAAQGRAAIGVGHAIKAYQKAVIAIDAWEGSE